MRAPQNLSPPVTDAQSPRSRAGAGARLAATMMTASTVQFTVGALAPLIVRDVGLGPAGLGVLVSCYYVVAGLSSSWLGRLVGRTGGRQGVRLVAVLSLCACLVVAIAPGLWGLAAGLALAGFAVAAANPATNLAIAQMSPPHGVLIGVKQSGFQLAAVVAGSVMPLVASIAGWRWSFAIGAVLSSVVLLCLVLFERRPPQVASPRKERAAGRIDSEVIGFAAYAFFMGVGTANANVYLVLFASHRVSFSPQVAGGLVLVLGLTSVTARIGWNLLLEHPPHRGVTQRSVLITLAAVAIAATVLIWSAESWGGAVLWIGAAALGLTAYAWNGVVNRGLVVRGGGGGQLGRNSGRVQGGFFFGLAAGPAVFGWLVDSTGSYSVGWLWSGVAFTTALVISLVMRPSRRLPAVDV